MNESLCVPMWLFVGENLVILHWTTWKQRDVSVCKIIVESLQKQGILRERVKDHGISQPTPRRDLVPVGLSSLVA